MSVLDLIPIKKKKPAPKGVAILPLNLPRYKPELIPSQHTVPPRLAAKLSKLGRRYVLVNLAERGAQIVSTALVLLTIQMFVDWLVDLPLAARFVVLAGDLGLLAFFVYRRVLPLILRPPNLEACALMVERHWPRFRGRMIATVQLAGPRFTLDSPDLVRAVQQETDLRTANMNFGEIVGTRVLKRRAGMALIVAILWVDLMILTAPGSFALLERVFLLPAKVPRKTEVICLSGNKMIKAGDNVLLEAQARGIVPSHGRVTLVDDSSRIQEITIDPEPGRPDHFSLEIDRVEQSFSYTIRLNDATSSSYEVKTVPQPHISSIDCEQIYPAYTGLDPVKRTVGNLALLAGSTLIIHAVADSKIVKAELKLAGTGQTTPLTIDGAEASNLTGAIQIPTTGLTGFSIEMTNEGGITSGDETLYGIDLIPDHPPTIQLTYPERLQELDTIKATPTIAFVASDDYGLAKVTLCYRITEDAGSDLAAPSSATQTKRIQMNLGQKLPLNMKNRYVWDLRSIQPPVADGTTLEYWMEAEDANNFTEPGITDSEHHTIKIVSDAEKKAEVMNRLMDSLNIITDISKNQVKVNKDLGEVIKGKAEKP
jgi:hypothetical protein